MSALDDFLSSNSGGSSDSSTTELDSFLGGSPPTTPAPVSASSPLDDFLSNPAPVATPHPAPTPSPFFQGKEPSGTFLGISDEVDPYSGKPYLAYRTPGATSTTTDTTRIAPKMNPEVAAPTAKENFENPRMPESASENIRKEQGATSNEQLDHRMALGLGGSNDTSNLKVIPTSENQAASANEGKAVGAVAAGTESLFQAQRDEAKAKGLPMPFTDDEIKAQGPGWLQTFLKGGEAAGHAILSAAASIPNGLEKVKEYFTGPAASPMENWKQNINPNFDYNEAQQSQASAEAGDLNAKEPADVQAQQAAIKKSGGEAALSSPLTVKYPFSHDVGTELPNNLGGQTVKGIIELPETLTKTLQEGFNALRGKTTAPDQGAYPITSDPQTAFNTFHDQIIAAGGDETTADWTATIGALSAGILDLTPLDGLLQGSVKAIAAGAAPTTEEQIAAHALLGSPTTLEEAKTAQLNALHLIGQGPGSNQEAASAVNAAYQTLQRSGIPDQGIIQRGARFANTLIQPVKFSEIPGLFKGKSPSGYQWANPDRQLPGYRSLTPNAPKMGLQMEPVERVGGAPEGETQTPYDTPGVIKARAEADGKTPTSEIDTPERQELRNRVADEVYGTGAAIKGKRLDIVSGGPGTRKSSMIAEPLAKEHGSFVADSDVIKPKLPEYGNGNGAPQVHKESAQINYKNMLKAMKNGDNIVYPTVASNAKRLQDVIDLFKQNGYDVHLHHASLPIDTATKGVVNRFEKGGQFIDPAYVPGATLQSNKTYATMKSYGGLTSSRYLSTEVPRSEQPRVLERRGESGGRPTEIRGGLDQGGSGRTPVRVRGSDRAESISSQGEEIGRLSGDDLNVPLHRPVRIYGDLESAKANAKRTQGYMEYRANVTTTGGQSPAAAHPRLGPKRHPVGRIDIPTAVDALMQAYDGEIHTGPFKGMSPEARDWFQNFVWRSRNVGIEARVSMKKFKDSIGPDEYNKLIAEGMQGLHDYDGIPVKEDGKLVFRDNSSLQKFIVAPRRDGAYGVLADIYKQLYDEEVAAGVPVREKQNYQPVRGVVKIPEGEMPATPNIEGRRIGLKPGFTLAREYDSHAELMAHGGVPLFTNLIDNLANRLNEHFAAMAKAQFWNQGVSTGYILPSDFAKNNEGLIKKQYPSAQYVSYNPDRVPSRTTSYMSRDTSVEKTNTYGWVGPKPLVDLVNGYLQEPITPFERGLRVVARGAASTRNMVLGVGIPKTALNVHYFNILPRDIAADLFAGKAGGIGGELGRTVGWTLYPTAAAHFIDENLDKAIPLYRSGMLFSTEGNSERELGEESSALEKLSHHFQVASHAWHRWFGGNLFGSFLPARMMQNGMRAAQKYIEQGLSEDDAYKRAATEINDFYGNIDAAALGKDKNLQNAIRAVLLAPNYTLNNVLTMLPKMARGIWQDIGKLQKPIEPGTDDYSLYAKYAYFILGLYGAANVLNYENSGHLMWQNDPLHQFDIDWGKDDQGKTRYVGIVGTGADMLRLPLEIASSIAQGKPQDILSSLRNRLSTFTAPLISLATNSDWKGDPIVGPDKYGKPQSPLTQVENIFNNTIGSQVPGQYQTLTGALGGKQSTEQTVTGVLGAPVKYKNTNPTSADVNALAAAGPKAQAVMDIKPIYAQVQALIAKGDTAGAQKIIDGLSDDQYVAYKTYKSAETAVATKKAEAAMLTQYQTIQQQLKSGDTAGAQRAVDGMTETQYKAYTNLKKRLGGQ